MQGREKSTLVKTVLHHRIVIEPEHISISNKQSLHQLNHSPSPPSITHFLLHQNDGELKSSPSISLVILPGTTIAKEVRQGKSMDTSGLYVFITMMQALCANGLKPYFSIDVRIPFFLHAGLPNTQSHIHIWKSIANSATGRNLQSLPCPQVWRRGKFRPESQRTPTQPLFPRLHLEEIWSYLERDNQQYSPLGVPRKSWIFLQFNETIFTEYDNSR